MEVYEKKKVIQALDDVIVALEKLCSVTANIGMNSFDGVMWETIAIGRPLKILMRKFKERLVKEL